MEQFTATELKQNSGKILDSALQAPVSILKHGRPVAVITSDREYQAYLNQREIQNQVQAGFSQIESGHFSTRSMDNLAAEARRRVEEKKKSEQVS